MRTEEISMALQIILWHCNALHSILLVHYWFTSDVVSPLTLSQIKAHAFFSLDLYDFPECFWLFFTRHSSFVSKQKCRTNICLRRFWMRATQRVFHNICHYVQCGRYNCVLETKIRQGIVSLPNESQTNSNSFTTCKWHRMIGKVVFNQNRYAQHTAQAHSPCQLQMMVSIEIPAPGYLIWQPLMKFRRK